MSSHRDHLVGEVHLILNHNNKVLLLQRSNTGFMDGYYHFPSGHKEQNETFIDALIREMKEEIALALSPQDVHLIHTVYHKSNQERIGLFFTNRHFIDQVPINNEPEKHGHIDWFNIDNLPSSMVPYTRQALLLSQQGVAYSEYDWKSLTR